jgi:hypothetical protein
MVALCPAPMLCLIAVLQPMLAWIIALNWLVSVLILTAHALITGSIAAKASGRTSRWDRARKGYVWFVFTLQYDAALLLAGFLVFRSIFRT